MAGKLQKLGQCNNGLHVTNFLRKIPVVYSVYCSKAEWGTVDDITDAYKDIEEEEEEEENIEKEVLFKEWVAWCGTKAENIVANFHALFFHLI